MKKLLLLLILPALIAAQSDQTRSLVELKNQISTEIDEQENLLLRGSMEKKSPGVAIIYSLLIPGMGELYADAYDRGIYFTIADGVLWGTFAGMNIYGNWKENSYRAFATAEGNVDLDGKDDKFFADIGSYISIDQYNREQKLNRNFDAVYDEETHYWKWENNAERSEFRNMWSSSESAYNNIRFAVGALIVNRIVSAINAVRLVSAYNKRIDELSWNVSMGISNSQHLPASLNLNFSTRF